MDKLNTFAMLMPPPELSDQVFIFKMDIDLTCSILKLELYDSKISQVKCKNTSCVNESLHIHMSPDRRSHEQTLD